MTGVQMLEEGPSRVCDGETIRVLWGSYGGRVPEEQPRGHGPRRREVLCVRGGKDVMD